MANEIPKLLRPLAVGQLDDFEIVQGPRSTTAAFSPAFMTTGGVRTAFREIVIWTI